MEIKVVIDFSERAASILSSIATALIIKETARQPECADADEKVAKERKATKKVKSDTHKDDQPEQISTKSVEQKAAETDGTAKQESAPQQPEAVDDKPADDKPAEAVDDKPAGIEKANEPCDDELGKGESGPVIAELTAKMITRINDECRDRAAMNRNLRATCEKLGLQFPTVPALIQAIGYGNAYKACVGE